MKYHSTWNAKPQALGASKLPCADVKLNIEAISQPNSCGAKSKLYQMLHDPEYNKHYVNFAKLHRNIKQRRRMLKLADQAEKTFTEKK